MISVGQKRYQITLPIWIPQLCCCRAPAVRQACLRVRVLEMILTSISESQECYWLALHTWICRLLNAIFMWNACVFPRFRDFAFSRFGAQNLSSVTWQVDFSAPGFTYLLLPNNLYGLKKFPKSTHDFKVKVEENR